MTGNFLLISHKQKNMTLNVFKFAFAQKYLKLAGTYVTLHTSIKIKTKCVLNIWPSQCTLHEFCIDRYHIRCPRDYIPLNICSCTKAKNLWSRRSAFLQVSTLLLYDASEDGSILSKKKCAGLGLNSWDFQKR